VLLLIDADAFLCLREWRFLELLRCLTARVSLVLTGYVARHELKDVQNELTELQNCNLLTVQDVKARTPAFLRFRQFQKDGADKGEAESIAWAVGLPSDTAKPVFVSQDRRARELATRNRLDAVDMFDLLILLNEHGLIEKGEVESRLASWDDDSHLACQPGDFTKFEATWEKHLTSRRMRTA